MRTRSAGPLGLLVLLLFVSRPAAAEIITFEEMSPGGGALPVLNFYADRGVIFRAVARDYSQGVPVPNFAHSGTKAIETCFAQEFCTVPIEMTFTLAQARVRVFTGLNAPINEPLTITMRAFAADDTQVAERSVPLAPSPAPTPIQTPIEITTATAVIVRVTVGVESGGAPSFSTGLAIDDVEFDVVGPPPPCTATQDPTVSITQPVSGTTVQFNQFLLAFVVTTGDPFAVTTVTDAGSAQTKTATFPGFAGTFGPTMMSGLLVPGPSTLTVAVSDCRGTAQRSVSITFTPIATDAKFHVLGLEATQVVQNIPSSVPLVADKPTVVRVYLRLSGSTPAVTGVRGRLAAYRPANSFGDLGLPLPGSVQSMNAITADQSADLKAKRLALNQSLNFQLPSDWITDGRAHFELRLDVDGSPSSPVLIPCEGCQNTLGNGRPAFSTFHPMPTLNLRIVGLVYAIGMGPVNQAPRTTDFALFESWVRRAFPAARFNVTTRTATATNTFPFNCNQANAQLASIRATEVASGAANPRTHYMGLVINTGGFMRGCSAGIPDDPDPSVVASSPTGDTSGLNPRPINASGDNDGSFGDWYGGHELMHTFGRKHPGFCNGNSEDDDDFPNPNGQISDNLQTFVGFDRGDAANSIPTTVISPFRFDIMTYCNQPQWFSSHNYLGVMRRFNDENGVSSNDLQFTSGSGPEATGSQAGADGSVTGDFVSIVATVNLTKQTGDIRYVDHVGRATAPAPLPNQLAAVRFVDGAGKVIESFPTWVREDSDLAPGEDRVGLVQVIVPVQRSAASLELVVQGRVVSRRVISKHAPVVKALRVSALATRLAGQPGRTLTWIGADLDLNRLTYLVQISGDGETWETLATGLAASKLTVTDEQLKGGSRRVRVIANDGFNVSEPATIEIPAAK